MTAITNGDADRFYVEGVATAALPAMLVLFLGSLRCGAAYAITGCCAVNQSARTASSLSTDQIYRIELSSQVNVSRLPESPC